MKTLGKRLFALCVLAALCCLFAMPVLAASPTDSGSETAVGEMQTEEKQQAGGTIRGGSLPGSSEGGLMPAHAGFSGEIRNCTLKEREVLV